MRETSASGLARALSSQRRITRQAAVLGAFLGLCALARLSPFHEPEPITGVTILLACTVLGIELVWAWVRHDEAVSLADELILSGFSGSSGRTPIERALQHRISSIERQRDRHRLADDLRWRLKLAAGTTRPSPGYMRACVLPPLDIAGRRVFSEEQPLVLELADRIEQAPVDPRALVILWRMLTTPGPVLAGDSRPADVQAATDAFRDSLRRARVLINAGGEGLERSGPQRRLSHHGPR